MLYSSGWLALAALLQKIGRTLADQGLSPEERAAGMTRQALTKQQLLDHLMATGKLPPGTQLGERGQLPLRK